MARTLPNDFVTEKNKTSQTAPWIWLVECRIDADNAIRVCQYTANVTWPTAGGNEYKAYPIRFDTLGSSSDDGEQATTVTISNADRQLTSYLEDNAGLGGKPVIVRLVHSSHLDETTVPEWRFEIADCSISRAAITWQLGPFSLYSWQTPYRRFNRGFCNHTYGQIDTGCPYNLDAPNAMTSCEKTWEDCELHGDNQVINNIERTCPRMCGVFRGFALPKQ